MKAFPPPPPVSPRPPRTSLPSAPSAPQNPPVAEASIPPVELERPDVEPHISERGDASDRTSESAPPAAPTPAPEPPAPKVWYPRTTPVPISATSVTKDVADADHDWTDPVLEWLPFVLAIGVSLAVCAVSLGDQFLPDDHARLFAVANGGRGSIWADRGAIGFSAFFRGVYGAFGAWPEPFHIIALLLHIANVAIVHRIVTRATGASLAAGCAAGLFGISPTNLGSLAHIGSYGQVIGTTALLGVLVYSIGSEKRREKPSAAALTMLFALALVAASTFLAGTAIGALTAIFVWATFSAEHGPGRRVFALAPLAVIVPAAHVALKGLAHQPLAPSASATSVVSSFGSLLAAGVADPLVSPFAGSAARTASAAGAVPSAPMLISAVTAATIGLVVVIVCFRSERTTRRRLLAFAAIALLGAAAGALDAASEARSSIAPIATRPDTPYLVPVASAVLLGLVLGRLRVLQKPPRLLAIALGLLLIFMALKARPAATAINTGNLPSSRETLVQAVASVRAEIESNEGTGPVVVNNRPLRVGLQAPRLDSLDFPGLAAAFLVLERGTALDGREVRFIEYDQRLLERIRTERAGTPIAELVVPPPAAAAPRTPLRRLPQAPFVGSDGHVIRTPP